MFSFNQKDQSYREFYAWKFRSSPGRQACFQKKTSQMSISEVNPRTYVMINQQLLQTYKL